MALNSAFADSTTIGAPQAYTWYFDKSGKSSSTALCTKPVRPVQWSSGRAFDTTGTNRSSGISATLASTQSFMYRSTGRRPPQYSTAGRCMFLNCICSISALMGAKPVPDASSTKGLALSSRKKKLPYGPSMRTISFSFMPANTWSVNLPPGMWRMWISMPGLSSWVKGALAIE